MTPQTPETYPLDAYEESEISFADIIEYLEGSWRWLLLGAVLGPVVAFLLAMGFTKYKAEIVLDNLAIPSKEAKEANTGLTFVEWRGLSETLPLLGSQLIEREKAKGQEPASPWLGSSEWWAKNVVPTYGLTKSDTKNLPEVGEALKGESTKIVNLKLSYESIDKDKALSRVDETVAFLRKGSLYLRLKNQLEAYRSEVILNDQRLKQSLLENDIELRYRKERAKAIESLIDSDSKSRVEGKIIVDVRNGEAKYLPLDTQLNAIKLEIDSLEEARQRLQDQIQMNEILKSFVDQADPLLEAEKEANGILLSESFLSIEKTIRSSLREDDWVRQSSAERLHSDLLIIQSRFSRQMPEMSRTVSKKLPIVPALAGGLFGGFLLAVVGTLFWNRYRQYLALRSVG